MKLTVDYKGAKDPGVELGEMAARLGDLTPVWPKVRGVVNQYSNELFISAGFGSFAPLKPSTLKKKRRSPLPFDTLSRRTVNSMLGPTGDSVFETTPTSCAIGTKVPILIYHMTGTRKMPARPLLKITERLIDLVAKVLADYGAGR